MERPSRGGEKRTAARASHHEERGSDGAIAPPRCAHRVVLHRCVVRAWCHPSGAAVAPGLHAAARTRRAARAVKGDVVSGWQVLYETPSAPPIPVQRVARFDDHCTRNCLLQNKLRQRYIRYMALSLIAVWFLIGETHRSQQVTPALTLPQVRYGLSVLLLETFLTLGVSSIGRHVQRQLMRNELARFYHHRTRNYLPPRKLRRDIQ